jgi:hypothetical protein
MILRGMDLGLLGVIVDSEAMSQKALLQLQRSSHR